MGERHKMEMNKTRSEAYVRDFEKYIKGALAEKNFVKDLSIGHNESIGDYLSIGYNKKTKEIEMKLNTSKLNVRHLEIIRDKIQELCPEYLEFDTGGEVIGRWEVRLKKT